MCIHTVVFWVMTACSLDADSALHSLHHVDVGRVADVSGIHAASFFRAKVNRVNECSCIYRFWSNRQMGRGGWAGLA
jgi:hypothetical protein